MSQADTARVVIDAFIRTFRAQKHLADAAIGQLSDEQLRRPLDENTNSVCVIMKHVGGNLRSRFSDFLMTDGEKPWRDRDDEFVDNFAARQEMLDAWELGWNTLFDAITPLEADELLGTVMIRGEPHSVPLALTRSLGHVSYHVGQIVQTARVLAKENWTVLTVPRGGSRAHNLKHGYDPRRA
jgi:hypothetical protein